MTTNKYSLMLVIFLMPFLSACVPLLVGGGAAVTTTSTIDRRTTGTQVEDQTIELKAIRLLNTDPDLKEKAHLNVTSYNTVVLLTGETPTEAMRQKAVELVKRVEKVSHIYDEITIAGPSSLAARTSDTYLTAKVKTNLLANKELSGLKIKVITEKGVVYLMGLITRAEAKKATEVTKKTAGVQRVVKLFQYTD